MHPLEAQFYETALGEVSARTMVAALAAKALVESEGDEKRAVARYIQLRVEHLFAEHEASRVKHQAQAEATAQHQRQVHIRALEASARFARSGQVDEESLAVMLAAAKFDPTVVRVSDRVRGNTLLHVCAERGLLEPIKLLLSAGADVNAHNGNGKSALAVAANQEVLSLLRQRT
jgi:hypothetical protein